MAAGTHRATVYGPLGGGIPGQRLSHRQIVPQPPALTQRFRQLQYWEDLDLSPYTTPNKKEFPLAKLLPELASFKATNPRDPIYGLNFMCIDPLKVEYSMAVEKVYLKAAKKLLEENDIDILIHNAGIGNRLNRDHVSAWLPSWVPNWTDVPQYGSIEGHNSLLEPRHPIHSKTAIWKCTPDAVLAATTRVSYFVKCWYQPSR